MTTPTTPDDASREPTIAEVMQALDMAVVEWDLEDRYRPLSVTPRWFTGTVPWSSLPFLQHFVAEARRFLHDHLGGVLASDQFEVQRDGEELLLRARALKLNGRLLVVIERLDGASDIRPILREARQQALDHELLAERARAVHQPIEKLARAVDDWQRGAGAGEPAVDAVVRAVAQLKQVAAALPPPRARKR
jgi:hypothetical protein